MAFCRPSARRRGITTPRGGWLVLASVVAATSAGVVLAAVSSRAAGAISRLPTQATLAQNLKLGTEAEKARWCHQTKEFLLDDGDAVVSTSWDPQQFEPAAATPCTVYSEAAVVNALGRTLAFAEGHASCCASAYFNWVLRPLSWMQVVGRPRGDLCIPDTYWENLGWHVANFATGMHQHVLAEGGSYGLPTCRFPDGLLKSLMEEAMNWACVYVRQATALGAEDATRFELPAYSNAVRPVAIPGSEVVAELRQCPADPVGGTSSRTVLPDGTGRLDWMGHDGGADEEGGDSFSTTVELMSPPKSGSAEARESRWHQTNSRHTPENDAKQQTAAASRRRKLAPSHRRCGRCPVRYTPINDRWCCARYCDWYSNSMALAVTSRLPSQFGCCVKMNKRCITSK